MKFGGSSVADPENIRNVASIVFSAARKHRVMVVVSAFQGVTNQLLECARLAERRDDRSQQLYQALAKRHGETLEALHAHRPPRRVRGELATLLAELHDVLQGITLLRHCSPEALDMTASFGERLSAMTIASYLRRIHPAYAVDARTLIVTDDRFTRAGVLFDKSNAAIRKALAKRSSLHHGREPIPVITGFIGATEDGRTTTIGRNGSDYTAAIVGGALDVRVIEIWTDVDGILSADPRAVSGALVIPQMSYEEAMELSYFGARVLHASTIAPAVKRRIPIVIKNSRNPSAAGTRISHHIDRWKGAAKGLASIDGCTLLTLRGLRMVGVPGTAERLFRALASHGVNVILISQASSEHTICFAVNSVDIPAATAAVHEAFRYEFGEGMMSLERKPHQTILAVVGDGMQGTPGVSGRIFQALGRNSINVSAIAQGASERNVSIVIDANRSIAALNVIHSAFFERRRILPTIVIGTGNIGGTFLRQLRRQQSFLHARGLDVRVCGLANSKRFLLSEDGIDLERWKEMLEDSPHRMIASDFLRGLDALRAPNAVVVDCTASPAIVDLYEPFLRRNLHIVTPNKLANVLPWTRYKRFRDLAVEQRRQFYYSATVGAGLPILSTVSDLVASGDQVVRIEGILSGTLGFLFNRYNGSKPFSSHVQEALELGYTEPDPRDDLSGADVGRKLLILARQLDLRMNLRDIRIESLVPRALRGGPFRPDFFRHYAEYDSALRRRAAAAAKRGCVLRYLGALQGRRASAGLREVPQDHLFAGGRGSDNIVAFTTHRYSQTPLVVQGPGAGADVTAMGVFADLLKLAHSLPE
jgi:aspartokinase/homoserine dehydrogenase 1